jgi:hypothetical protein
MILFTEVPFRRVRVSAEDSVPFYPWIWTAVRKATGTQGSAFVLFDGPTVLTGVKRHGLEPVVLYVDKKHHAVAHLGFYDDQMSELSAVAQELGAAFLIRARLVANDARLKRLREKQVLGVKIQGDFTELARSASVEFTVYDVAANRVAFTREFTSSDSSARADTKVAGRIAAGMMRALSGQETGEPEAGIEETDSAVVAVERTAVVETVAMGSVVKSSVPAYRVTLQRIVLRGDLLRFDMDLWNTTDEEVRAVVRRTPQNEIESYIIDSLRIRTRAASTSLENMTLFARAGEKVGFFIVFPVPATNLKKVSVSSLWDLRAPSQSLRVTVDLKQVTLP